MSVTVQSCRAGGKQKLDSEQGERRLQVALEASFGHVKVCQFHVSDFKEFFFMDRKLALYKQSQVPPRLWTGSG